MMNLVAIAFLISYLSAVVVFVPEPQLGRADVPADGSTNGGLFDSAKGAVQNAFCDQEPCPSSIDQVKDTLREGYGKTGEGINTAKEGVKETVHGAYDQSKHGVQNTAEWAKQGIQDGAHETAQAVQERAGQAKQGIYDTAHYAKDGLKDRGEQVKQGVQEVPEKMASYIPSKEEAKSYIPGVETSKQVTDTVKQKVGEVKETISLDSLRYRLDELRKDAAQYMQGRETESSYPIFADMKRKLDEASGYVAGKETGTSYVPGMDTIQDMKRGVQETAAGVQHRVTGAGESVHDAAKDGAHGLYDKSQDMVDSARDTAASYKESGEGAKEKVGGVFQGLKDRFGGNPKGRRAGGPLERRVQDLCLWFGDGADAIKSGRSGATSFLDVSATRQSYAYLMQSALGGIQRALEVFDHATTDNAGVEWREKYVYLADSSKGALEAAKEVFERTASAVEGTLLPRQASSQRTFGYGSGKNMSKLRVAAAHTKERLHATIRPLTRSLYLAAFSIVYGLTLWTTFLSGYLLSRALPRQQLAMVQSKLFPVYLRIITVFVTICGVIHAILHPWPSADRPEHWQYLNLGLCIAAGLLNMLIVEPRATKMVVEKLKVEKEEGRGQSGQAIAEDDSTRASIDTKLKGFHELAAYLNLAIVAGLTWHLWYLANRLAV